MLGSASYLVFPSSVRMAHSIDRVDKNHHVNAADESAIFSSVEYLTLEC
jgi:hypothetical protein